MQPRLIGVSAVLSGLYVSAGIDPIHSSADREKETLPPDISVSVSGH